MKRTLVLIVVAAVLGAVAVGGHTHAQGSAPDVTATAGYPTLTPLAPVKLLSVSGAVPGPLGVNSYTISVTSSIGCFSLSEPVLLSVLGNHGEAVLRQTNPLVIGGNPYLVRVAPSSSGTATIAMEVWTSQVGPAGLVVSAIWPEEGVERLQTVFAPSATPVPTEVVTPAPAVTPGPTATPVPKPLTLATCYSAATSSIDIQSVPGAVCTLSLSLTQGFAPHTTYNSGPFVIPDTGVGEVPFTPAPTTPVPTPASGTPVAAPNGGTAVTTCSAGGQTVTDRLTFTVGAS
jgi:hypothetical protein